MMPEVAKMFNEEIERLGITVIHEFAPELPLLNADAERLKQVFLNLFKNAIEAMPSGGKLMIGAAAQNQAVAIHISDTGIGIPQQVDIFQPFTTTKQSGSGLGLSVVRELLAAHGGTISYTSGKGEGTTFKILLPLTFEQTGATVETSA